LRQLSTLQNYILLIGAIMMVVGVGCIVFGIMPKATSIIFCVGTISFALMQMTQTYEGNNITLKRLRHIMVLADIAFIISGLLMLEKVYKFFFPIFATSIEGCNTYLHVVYNNWVVALLIGAVLEIYTTHRIAYVIKKEENDTDIDNE